ncbi:MAG TPA: preprotein translocase subunit SecG [Stellaceae bacterium]|jgi:preprotein translocase subunit SecG
MIILILVLHIMIAISLVGVILLQKSEGGGLGIGGSTGGMSGFMTGRSTANLLTRATAILAAAFMTTSVLLVVLHNRQRAAPSIIGPSAPAGPVVPLSPGAPAAPAAPVTPGAPAAPPAPGAPSAPLAH